MSTRLPNRLARFLGRTSSPRGRSMPRYRVILHRTERDLPSVVRTLRRLAHFADAEATFRMWDAYQNGRTLVLVTHLERAELFVEQFGAAGLPASVEPE
jgi:ATP-dependent Clp protease adaptor protein ClpS